MKLLPVLDSFGDPFPTTLLCPDSRLEATEPTPSMQIKEYCGFHNASHTVSASEPARRCSAQGVTVCHLHYFFLGLNCKNGKKLSRRSLQ